jgi:hypothetical protein
MSRGCSDLCENRFEDPKTGGGPGLTDQIFEGLRRRESFRGCVSETSGGLVARRRSHIIAGNDGDGLVGVNGFSPWAETASRLPWGTFIANWSLISRYRGRMSVWPRNRPRAIIEHEFRTSEIHSLTDHRAVRIRSRPRSDPNLPQGS